MEASEIVTSSAIRDAALPSVQANDTNFRTDGKAEARMKTQLYSTSHFCDTTDSSEEPCRIPPSGEGGYDVL